MLPPDISLVVTAGICAILDGSGYEMVTALMAWEDMSSVDRLVVTLILFAQLLSLFKGPGIVSILAIEDLTRLVQDRKEFCLSLPFHSAVGRLRFQPS